jgi:hypothetical protein
MTTTLTHMAAATRGYAPINGLKMYYEIEGTGDPLVHIPPAFGYAGLKSFPALIQGHSVITMDSRAMVAPRTYRIVRLRSSNTSKT